MSTGAPHHLRLLRAAPVQALSSVCRILLRGASAASCQLATTLRGYSVLPFQPVPSLQDGEVTSWGVSPPSLLVSCSLPLPPPFPFHFLSIRHGAFAAPAFWGPPSSLPLTGRWRRRTFLFTLPGMGEGKLWARGPDWRG